MSITINVCNTGNEAGEAVSFARDPQQSKY